MTKISRKEVATIERALGLLDAENRVRAARSIHEVARKYLDESESAYEASGSTSEIMGVWTTAMISDLLFTLAETISPLHKEEERTEKVHWESRPEVSTAEEEWEGIFSAAYPNYSVSFHIAADPGRNHIGYVEMIFSGGQGVGRGGKESQEEAKGQIHRIFLDRHAVLDWGLGLGFISSLMLRPPGIKPVQIEQTEQGDDTIAA